MTSFYQFPSDLIKKDIEKYKKDAEAFKNGKIHPTKFKAFRVPCGVYEQRTENTFMVRIKSPAGGLTSDQMRMIATLSEKYGNSMPHITTRQEMQIHWVNLTDPPLVMEELQTVSLTTKGGGGNTVRNVTACYDSGVCADEAFDVAPYAIALSEFMLPDPASYSLPRKYKAAFSGCNRDCALATINDIGFIARKKVKDGNEIRGFALYMAGGMGAYSRKADLFEEFIPADDILYYAEGLKRFFDKNGNRKSKHKARIRFMLDNLGHDEFKKRLYEEIAELKKERKLTYSIKTYPANLKPAPEAPDEELKDPAYLKWLDQNIEPQKEQNYYMVKIRLPLGDISAAKLTKLADIVDRFGEGTIRVAHGQNFVLRWAHKNELGDLYLTLRDEEIIADDITELKDIVCCAGAATCKLGIGLSRGLSKGIFDRLNEEGNKYDDIKGVTIRTSGCANSCGQHPIGQIGLHGVARRVDNHMTLFYKVLLGGRVEVGKTALAESMGIVPAKNIPNLLASFLDIYKEEKQENEDYYQFLTRAGYDLMKKLVEEFTPMPTYDEDSNYYKDWSSDEDFSLAGLGAGECGAGVFDMIEVDLKEAETAIALAKDTTDTVTAANLFKKAMVHSARALLVTRGSEASDDSTALSLFGKEFIESGIADKKHQNLLWAIEEYLQENLTPKAIVSKQDEITEFSNMISELYKNMDDSLRFNVAKSTDGKEKDTNNTPAETIDKSMDLRGVLCPFNYVKAKIALETMETGQKLEIFLDDGEPINNVPGSLKNDGQVIHITEKIDNYFRLLIEKKA